MNEQGIKTASMRRQCYFTILVRLSRIEHRIVRSYRNGKRFPAPNMLKFILAHKMFYE
jgi:hypothetical protein